MLTTEERRTLQVLSPLEVEILIELEKVANGGRPHPGLLSVPGPCLCYWEYNTDSYVMTAAGRAELDRLREKEREGAE